MNKTAKAHLVECVIIFALWLWACVGGESGKCGTLKKYVGDDDCVCYLSCIIRKSTLPAAHQPTLKISRSIYA